MIDFYYWPTPNGHKITMFLEESDLSYQIIPPNIDKGEQFEPKFLAFSPNNRMPAIIDHIPADHGEPIGGGYPSLPRGEGRSIATERHSRSKGNARNGFFGR